jgi:hypothetical protein
MQSGLGIGHSITTYFACGDLEIRSFFQIRGAAKKALLNSAEFLNANCSNSRYS